MKRSNGCSLNRRHRSINSIIVSRLPKPITPPRSTSAVSHATFYGLNDSERTRRLSFSGARQIVWVCTMGARRAPLRWGDLTGRRPPRALGGAPPYHLAPLHQGRLDDRVDYFTCKTRAADPADEPLGRVIVGPAGYG